MQEIGSSSLSPAMYIGTDMFRLFYVYELIDPLTMLPFYVGKGYANRMYVHVKRVRQGRVRNVQLFKVIKNLLNCKHDVIYKKVLENVDELRAIQKEIELISFYGKRSNGGILVNITDGGEGCSGYKHTDATKDKLSQLSKGRRLTLEQRKTLSDALKESQKHSNTMKSDQYRQNLSKALKGRVFSEQHKQHIRDIARNKQDSSVCERCNRVFKSSTAFGKHKKSCNDAIDETMKKIVELYRIGHSMYDIKAMGYKSSIIRKSIKNLNRNKRKRRTRGDGGTVDTSVLGADESNLMRVQVPLPA